MGKRYLDLKRGAAARLAELRRLSPDNWRAARACGFATYASYCGALSQGYNGDKPAWYCHTGAQFRGEMFADECADAPRYVRDNRGWYTDSEFQDGTIRGIIARLPHGRWITGTYSSDHGERVYYPDLFDDASEAARAADASAEFTAEREREHSDRWRARQRLEDRIADYSERLCECLALRHVERFAERVREEAHTIIRGIRKARGELAEMPE